MPQEGSSQSLRIHLGVIFCTLAADLRHHHIIGLPIDSRTKRLGPGGSCYTGCLRTWSPKSEVQRRYNVSTWSILLIELDRPELNDANRRQRLSENGGAPQLPFYRVICNRPRESRNEFGQTPGRILLLAAEAQPKLAAEPSSCTSLDIRKGKLKVVKSTHPLDQAASLLVRQMARQEL